ncbi:ZPR1 zinc finger domain-containing protein [Methanolobus mangrovi]|uniref:ZPR1 zinc finger domain-containing protein n=1 Tax=Methanolobus mangrovi TaxID=3072977 RepID=A0AA51UFW5_9EURY|nr:ZPR1 zinc finger domain-containing protein [Methanolobus mangrovi]WMW22438.1 ZPR1 zinc finger domain-containing protein [Methanolobus mangrovi]
MIDRDSCHSFETRTSCPLCHEDLVISWQGDDIPYFGEVMYITALCKCSFRFADTIILSQKEPMRYELNVEGLEDLNSRVIRSTSGTIRIPELGIDVEPGSISDSYITNIEGVLDRIYKVVITATKWSVDDEEKHSKGLEIQKALEEAMDGKRSLTVIIEDPFGNSAIISDKAKSCVLSSEDMAHLKTGMIVFDVNSSEMELDASDSEHQLKE